MMTCPVCCGAFSWQDDLLHHFGAVHHLEELITHLESEFPCEPCPPCCRVPRTLFKSLLQEPASVKGDGTAQCAQENQQTITERSHTDMPVRRRHQSADKHARGYVQTKELDNKTSPRSKCSDAHVDSIERYHCDLCEFSTNDISQLIDHSTEHQSQTTPLPSTPDEILGTVVEEKDNDDHSVSSRAKQVQDRYFCNLCPFSTKPFSNFSKHMNSHRRSASVKDGYKCGYCNMACKNPGVIRNHQTVCHRHQPIKVCQVEGGKVVNVSGDSKSVSKMVKSKSCLSTAKKQRTLKPLKLKRVIPGSNTRLKQRTNKQPVSSSSLNTAEVLGSAKEGLTAAVESQLPQQMIYRQPVSCPLCDFSNRAYHNLVRHIRLNHGNHQRSDSAAAPTNSCSSSVQITNYANVDSDNPASVSQV